MRAFSFHFIILLFLKIYVFGNQQRQEAHKQKVLRNTHTHTLLDLVFFGDGHSNI